MKQGLTEQQIREYQEMSIEIMKHSIEEKRNDGKIAPRVGAVLVTPKGVLVDTACRGELREGDHAEFTLLERKHRADCLDGDVLFATLEPCAPGSRRHPKLGCAERISNARLSKVYIGIEDPDPTVARKGIQHLIDKGIEVEMYPRDLQDIITKENEAFLSQAKERAILAAEEDEQKAIILTQTETAVANTNTADLDEILLAKYVSREKWGCEYPSDMANRLLIQMGIFESKEGVYTPTGVGLLLFGKHPQTIFPNAVIRATYKQPGKNEEIKTISGPLLLQPEQIFKWYSEKIGKQIDRSKAEREEVYEYPIVAINEIVKNAILHRDYDILGAPIYMEISAESIIVKSPGAPVAPLKIEQIEKFSAPSLSRNPKIIHVFDIMRLAEQRGLGFSTVRRLPDDNIPLPLVAFEAPYIQLTLPFNRKVTGLFAELSEQEQKGLELIRMSDTPVKRSDYEKHVHVEKKTAERQIKRLIDLNLIEKVGNGPSTTYIIKKKEI